MKIKSTFGWYPWLVFILFGIPLVLYRVNLSTSHADSYRLDIWNVCVATFLIWWTMFSFRIERKKK